MYATYYGLRYVSGMCQERSAHTRYVSETVRTHTGVVHMSGIACVVHTHTHTHTHTQTHTHTHAHAHTQIHQELPSRRRRGRYRALMTWKSGGADGREHHHNYFKLCALISRPSPFPLSPTHPHSARQFVICQEALHGCPGLLHLSRMLSCCMSRQHSLLYVTPALCMPFPFPFVRPWCKTYFLRALSLRSCR